MTNLRVPRKNADLYKPQRLHRLLGQGVSKPISSRKGVLVTEKVKKHCSAQFNRLNCATDYITNTVLLQSKHIFNLVKLESALCIKLFKN